MTRLQVPCCCRYISSKISLRSLVKPVILILFLILVFYYHSELFAATRGMMTVSVSNTQKAGLDFTIRYSAKGKMKVRLIWLTVICKATDEECTYSFSPPDKTFAETKIKVTTRQQIKMIVTGSVLFVVKGMGLIT